MILGLDVSTRCVGVCILDDEGKWIKSEAIDLSAIKDLYEKARVIRNCVYSALPIPKYVFIEEAPMMFSGGSSAHVMSLLQRFNGMITGLFALGYSENINPIMIGAATARKKLGIEFPRKRAKKETKMCVVDHIRNNNLMPGYEWKQKKTGTLKDYCYDVADAYVIAKAGYLIESDRLAQEILGPASTDQE